MTFDFIPLSSYTPLYHHIILLVTLFAFIELQLRGYTKNRFLSIGLMLFAIIYMGFRPISGAYFGDMSTYARHFEWYSMGGAILKNEDILFRLFMQFCSRIMDVNTFFLICAILYIIPLYILSKKWFNSLWFYAFLILVGSFSFWSYGVNGIRNGIAGSFFLLAMSRNKLIYRVLWLVLSVGFHKSMLLPTVGYIATWFYNVPKTYFFVWIAAIPLSLLLPGFWENLLTSMVDDDRAAAYLIEEDIHDNQFSYTGFRWDFLLYSAIGVFAGWYYLFKKRLKDVNYQRLFNTFLFANAIWILVIRANFSNRFAYLSWFMLALVVVYPWLTAKFEKSQTTRFAYILLGYYLFTYIMNVFVYG